MKAAPIVLPDVPLARLADPAFTSLLQYLYLEPAVLGSQPQFRILYEVLLPFLIDGKSVAHAAAQVDGALYSTAQRVPESRVRTCLAVPISLAHRGASAAVLQGAHGRLGTASIGALRSKHGRVPMTASDIRTVKVDNTALPGRG